MKRLRLLAGLATAVAGSLALVCSSSPTQIAGNGGGTETVIGRVIDVQGTPMPLVQVKLMQHDHSPLDGADSLTVIDTTDAQGVYRLDRLAPSVYRVQLRGLRNGSRAVRWELPIFEGLSSMELTPDTVRAPGSIVIALAPGTFEVGGAFYIPGTDWAAVIAPGDSVAGSITLDSVAASVIPLVKYRARTGLPIGLAESISVRAGAETSVGAALPPPWLAASVAELRRGGVLYDGGTMTVIGGGYDIWSVADNFFFVYQPLQGNGEIIARLVRDDAVAAFDKAGIMLRQSLGSQSPNVSLCFERFSNTTGSGPSLALMQRTAAGDSTHALVAMSGLPPVWLRLSRTDSLVTGFSSVNGIAWDTIGTDTMRTTGPLLAGLCVSSHDSLMLKRAVFDSVSVR